MAAAVFDEDGAGDDRRGRHAIIALDDRVDVVRGEHFERRALGRAGQRVRVLAHVKRSINALAAPVVADGLRDGQNVRLGERAAQRRAAMPAGTEADALGGVVRVGRVVVVLALEPAQIHQHLPRSRLAGERRNRHVAWALLLMSGCHLGR